MRTVSLTALTLVVAVLLRSVAAANDAAIASAASLDADGTMRLEGVVQASQQSQPVPAAACEMTYTYPIFTDEAERAAAPPPLDTAPSPSDACVFNSSLQPYYRLMRYRDARLPEGGAAGTRVAFVYVPGHAGSYEQGRSPLSAALLAAAHVDVPALAFSLDLAGEPSALLHDAVTRQARFLSHAIAYASCLTQRAPATIIVIAHSMGGIAARLAVTSPHVAASVALLLTLASPHTHPPLELLPGMTSLYRSLQLRESAACASRSNASTLTPCTSNVALIAMTGGALDTQVYARAGGWPSTACDVNRSEPDTRAACARMCGDTWAWVRTLDMHPFHGDVDHAAIVWCGQTLTAVEHAMSALLAHMRAHADDATHPASRIRAFTETVCGVMPNTSSSSSAPSASVAAQAATWLITLPLRGAVSFITLACMCACASALAVRVAARFIPRRSTSMKLLTGADSWGCASPHAHICAVLTLMYDTDVTVPGDWSVHYTRMHQLARASVCGCVLLTHGLVLLALGCSMARVVDHLSLALLVYALAGILQRASCCAARFRAVRLPGVRIACISLVAVFICSTNRQVQLMAAAAALVVHACGLLVLAWNALVHASPRTRALVACAATAYISTSVTLLCHAYAQVVHAAFHALAPLTMETSAMAAIVGMCVLANALCETGQLSDPGLQADAASAGGRSVSEAAPASSSRHASEHGSCPSCLHSDAAAPAWAQTAYVGATAGGSEDSGRITHCVCWQRISRPCLPLTSAHASRVWPAGALLMEAAAWNARLTRMCGGVYTGTPVCNFCACTCSVCGGNERAQAAARVRDAQLIEYSRTHGDDEDGSEEGRRSAGCLASLSMLWRRAYGWIRPFGTAVNHAHPRLIDVAVLCNICMLTYATADVAYLPHACAATVACLTWASIAVE